MIPNGNSAFITSVFSYWARYLWLRKRVTTVKILVFEARRGPKSKNMIHVVNFEFITSDFSSWATYLWLRKRVPTVKILGYEARGEQRKKYEHCL